MPDKKRHTLQKLTFTEYAATSQTFLYFRPRGQYQYDDESGRICLCRGSSAAFNTLFNSVNYYKWHTYAHVDNVFLELRLQGKFKIVLTSECYGLDDAQTRVFYFDSSRADSSRNAGAAGKFISLEDEPEPEEGYPVNNAVCSFAGLTSFPNLYCEVIALSENAVIHGGEYFTMIEDAAFTANPVRLAVVIIAHKQDAQVAELAAMLEAALAPDTRVHVMDNGNTLAGRLPASPALRLVPNKNAGAAGGFARGLMEVLRDGGDVPFTHLLSLEGDVTISPDMPARLCNFLALTRPEYAKSAVSLAQMDAGLRYRQISSGGFWLGTKRRLLKNRYDLRDFTLVKKNEIADGINVTSWMGACIPLRGMNDKSLPLPLFTGREAEAEFFLRAARGVITLNGLCLWHPDNADPPWSAYYRMRNVCAVAAARGRARPAKIVKRALFETLLEHAARFRYAEAELALDGFEDFCRGVDWLKAQNPEELHKRALEKAPVEKAVDRHSYGFVYGNYERDKKTPGDSLLLRLLRKLTLNGMLLPAGPARALPVSQTVMRQFYRLRRVFFYNERTQTGYVATRNVSALLALARRWLAVRRLADTRYADACEEYRQRRDELASRAFWEEYLGMGEGKK